MSDDGYTRITLRIPDALDARLNEEARATSKSKNAEIVARLEASLKNPAEDSPTLKMLGMIRELQGMVETLLREKEERDGTNYLDMIRSLTPEEFEKLQRILETEQRRIAK